MSTSIPYDPSLELANIVPQEKIEILSSISEKQSSIETAEDNLNSALLTLRSFNITKTELGNLGVDINDVTDAIETAQKNVKTAADHLMTERLTNMQEINNLKIQLGGKISSNIESPVDYNRTQIKKMPLSADSVKMDAQYFSFDGEAQDVDENMKKISSFVSASTSVLGHKKSFEVTGAVEDDIARQRENHKVDGTLIITASTTHKDALLLAPFCIDVDKGIRAWNKIITDDTKKIKTNDPGIMQNIADEQETVGEPVINIISGATYGSSFVGMVHVLKNEKTDTEQRMTSVASQLQAQMEAGSWFRDISGGFGVDSQFANDAKRLLSTQDINSHISIVCMGAIPSIKSSEVQIGVKTFSDFDPEKMMGKLATLANATRADQKSVSESAESARTGQKMIEIRSSEIKSVMTGLGEIDDGKNKLLDINSLMIAFENFIEKVLSGDAGVPITYYIKPITRSQLAQMWVEKYFPNKYLTSSGDDNDDDGEAPDESEK